MQSGLRAIFLATMITSCGVAAERPLPPALYVRDVPASALAAALSEALGRPVMIHADAANIAESAQLTLIVPAGTPAPAIMELATRALETSRLTMNEEDGILVIRRGPGGDGLDDPSAPSLDHLFDNVEGTALEAPARARTDEPPPTGEVSDPPGQEGIRQVAENTFEVDYGTASFAAPEWWMSAGRFIPHEDAAGTSDGVAVFGIRRGSVFSSLGLRNGDIVHRVAERSMARPDEALALGTTLSALDHFDVELERDGAPLTLHYRRAPQR